MITAGLVQTLASEIKECLKKIKLPTEYMREPTEPVQVNVFEQYLPADLFEQTSYYPCVVVEWLKTEDDLKAGSVMTIGLTIGVYAKEADGYLDAFHIMEVIRQRLLSKRTIGKKYRLIKEATWETPNEQPTPFFFVVAELMYSNYLVQEEFPA